MAARLTGPSRTRDEIILAWLGLRSSGWTLEKIAQVSGKSLQNVATTINNVKKADIEECAFFGDDQETVKGKYW